MARLRNKFYNHLNVTSNTDNYDENSEVPIDTDDQEELINQFRSAQSAQTKKFINLISIVYLVPLPFYIMSPGGKKLPFLSFFAIVSVLGSILNLKYVDVGVSGSDTLSDELIKSWLRKVPVKNKELVLSTVNNVIALGLVIVIWSDLKESWRSLMFLIPLIVSASSTIMKKWILNDQGKILAEVDKLEGLKYKHKTV